MRNYEDDRVPFAIVHRSPQHTFRRFSGLLIGLSIAVFGLVAAGPASAANQAVTISQSQVRFEPPRVAVKPGESVTWDNKDTQEAHNVRFEDGLFTNPSPPTVGPWTTPPRTFPAEGMYRYYCEIHGNPGGVGMAGVVYVNPTATLPPLAPVASFTMPDSASVGQNVSFDATASTDSDGTIAKYQWDLDGDGIYERDSGATPTTSRSYTTPGTRLIQLRVTDSQGLKHEVFRPLQITAPAPGPRPTQPAPIVPAPKVAMLPPGLPSFASSKKTVTVSRSGRFAYSFAATAGLSGTVKLASTKKVNVSARRRVRLPAKRFTVPGSGKVTVKMKLSRKNLRILKRNKRIRFRAAVTVRNAAGLERSSSATITLKKPRGR